MSDKAGQSSHQTHQSFWLWVMCLTGVDYFSTLGYQPSLAFEATGLLSPISTLMLVLLTLLGALPVYMFVASRSPHGQGSIGMLERLVHGWTGKTMVLVLLGFAGTDFVITKTLSAADAAEHLISNPYWPYHPHTPDMELKQRLIVTMLMLAFLGAMFMRGFREVIGLAVCIVAIYLVLNAFIVGSCLYYLANHPELIRKWLDELSQGNWHLHEAAPISGTGLLAILVTAFWFFPKLALGLSGFETGVAVMPLIRGDAADTAKAPGGRIRNARKLLITAAAIMTVFLISSSLVVCTLIEPKDLLGSPENGTVIKPPAKDRALAFLAHGEAGLEISPIFGNVLGTIYDISTIVILWFAGASAMAGLLNLVPQYLPRYGMAPEWAQATRPLVLLFTVIAVGVTWIFDASVTAQGGAYATGVLVLMTSGCVATVIERWRTAAGPWTRRTPWYFVAVTAVFVYTTAANMYEKPDGIKIASCFIATIVVSSIVSRAWRSTELRFRGFQYKNEESRFLWNSMQHIEFPVLVPHRPGSRKLADKEEIIRREHRLTPDVPIVFIEAYLGDTSDFYQEPVMEAINEGGHFILRITQCASIAHVLAALGLELSKVGKPPEIHFGWSDESPLAANLGFLLFGEGNVPWLVQELLRKAEPNPERRPRVVIG